MINNNIIEKPITISDIRGLLGVSSYDLGTLCSSNKVNMWSKHKPFRYHALFIADTQRENILVQQKYGLNMPVFRATSNACVLDMANGIVDGSALWGYLAPRGKAYNEPFRIEDFYKYCNVTNWSEGPEPALPQILNFPLNIAVHAGVEDGLGNDTLLKMFSQDSNNVNSYVLNTSDLMRVELGDNPISSMFVGVALIPDGVTLSTSNIHVWLTGVNIKNVIGDATVGESGYDIATRIGTLEENREYYVAPFLYYGLTYNSWVDTSHTVPLASVDFSNSKGDALVSYIGNRTYTRIAIAKTLLATGISLSLGTNAVATITFKMGDDEITYSRFFLVLCSDEVLEHDYFNDVEVPYGDMTFYWMSRKSDNSLTWVNVSAGGGGLTVSQKINNTVTSGSCTASSPMAVRYTSGSNTSTVFGYAVDITDAIGILQKNKTYTLTVTLSGRVSDSGGNFNNAYFFYANNSVGYNYDCYIPIK